MSKGKGRNRGVSGVGGGGGGGRQVQRERHAAGMAEGLTERWQALGCQQSPCSGEEGENATPAPFLLLPYCSLGLGEVSYLLQMRDGFH